MLSLDFSSLTLGKKFSIYWGKIITTKTLNLEIFDSQIITQEWWQNKDIFRYIRMQKL